MSIKAWRPYLARDPPCCQRTTWIGNIQNSPSKMSPFSNIVQRISYRLYLCPWKATNFARLLTLVMEISLAGPSKEKFVKNPQLKSPEFQFHFRVKSQYECIVYRFSIISLAKQCMCSYIKEVLAIILPGTYLPSYFPLDIGEPLWDHVYGLVATVADLVCRVATLTDLCLP